MPINFNLVPIQSNPRQGPIAQAQAAPTPSGGGGDGGIGELFSGLQGLLGGIGNIGSGNGGETSSGPTGGNMEGVGVNPGYHVNQPQMPGISGPSNVAGVNPNFRPAQIGSNNQSGLQTLLNTPGQHSIFENAQKTLGLKEGSPILTDYLKKSNPNLDPAVTPWCAGYVGSVLNASGIKGTGSLAAKSYLGFGNPTQNPTRGDIVVLNRTDNPNLGHVGFVDSIDPNKGIVNVLGGNQNNSVSVKSFPLSSVAGFRTPPSGQQVQHFAVSNGIKSPTQLANIPTKVDQHQELSHIMEGIAGVESSGAKNPYSLISKPSRNGDRAHGKYQIMGNNIPAWSREVLGYPISKEQFLASPELQEKIVRTKVAEYYKKYGNERDVWSMWFSGRPEKKAGNAKDVYGTTVPVYLKKATQYYLKSKTSVPTTPIRQTQVSEPYFNSSNPGTPGSSGRWSIPNSNTPIVSPNTTPYQMPQRTDPEVHSPYSQFAQNNVEPVFKAVPLMQLLQSPRRI